jgi:hypothetical protein
LSFEYLARMFATLDGLDSFSVVIVALVIGGLAMWSRSAAGANGIGRVRGDKELRRPRNVARRLAGATLVIVVLVLVTGAALVQSYNPLGQSFWTVKGEFSSYVASATGTEARSSSTAVPGLPGSEQIWKEPSGRFSVQVETEIDNIGAHAVRIDGIGEPDFGYRVIDYRISFFHYRTLGSEAGSSFQPFTLAAHTERMVVVRYSQSCDMSTDVEASMSSGTMSGTSTGSTTMIPGMSSLPVTYSFFGFAHTDDIPVMPFALQTPQVC